MYFRHLYFPPTPVLGRLKELQNEFPISHLFLLKSAVETNVLLQRLQLYCAGQSKHSLFLLKQQSCQIKPLKNRLNLRQLSYLAMGSSKNLKQNTSLQRYEMPLFGRTLHTHGWQLEGIRTCSRGLTIHNLERAAGEDGFTRYPLFPHIFLNYTDLARPILRCL